MSILSYTPYAPGLFNVTPRTYYLTTTDSLGTVTTAGYLNRSGQALQGQNVLPTDVIEAIYGYSTTTQTGTYAIFTPSIASNGEITLVQWSSPGAVTLPVTSGNLAVFNNVNGTIADDGYTPAGASGYLMLSPGGFTINNVLYAIDSNGTLAQAGYNYENILPSQFDNADTISNLISNYNITCSAAALASAGTVLIQASTGTKQYVITDIRLNYSAAGLSGGGGNRLLNITDGTSAYTHAGITAALLETPVNTAWGGTGLPLPLIAMNTPTVAGANLYAQYIGGTTDFTTGSVNISVEVLRIA